VPDGGVPVMSLVERGLQLEGYRKLRRKLPKPLRQQLPINPPECMEERRGLVWRVLRERRRMLADEAEVLAAQARAPVPELRVSISDAAKLVGCDRSTVVAWLEDAPTLRHDRGIVIDGAAARAIMEDYSPDAPLGSEAEALAALSERVGRGIPPEPTGRFVYTGPWLGGGPPYTPLGTGDPTVEQLAAMLENPDQRKSIFPPGRVRQLLAKYGATVRAGERVDREWLKSPAGQRFWVEAYSMAAKKFSIKHWSR
jgi:hypothetical protein